MHFIKANWMADALRGLAVTTLLVSGIAAPCSAQINFQYNFSGSFVTDSNAAAERQAVIDGGKLFSSEFGKYFSNSATLTFDVDGINSPTSPVIASAGSDYQDSATLPGIAKFVVAQKLQDNFDSNGATADGSLEVNFHYSYGLDPNAQLQNGQFDLFAIFNHEYTHALGFFNFINPAGLGAGGLAQYSVYDTFLTDKNGNKILNPDFTVNQAAFDSAKLGSLNGGGFFFDGANAEAANGGALVALYSPNAYTGDVSHLDSNVFPDDLMVPGRDVYPTPETRQYSGIDVGILTDLGYTRVPAAVPEASTTASFGLLLVLGMGGLVIAAKRKKTNAQAGSPA